MAPSAKKSSKSLVDRETDARFWAQTHYKIGQKLDPNDPTDRKMMPIWVDIWGKVKREDAQGRLVLTYNHPAVEESLDNAALSTQAAAGHLDAATREADPGIAQSHVHAATGAAAAASSAAQRASAIQPPTVSPIIVDAAAAMFPILGPLLSSLPPGHPAVASPAAQPVLPPSVVASPSPVESMFPPLGPINPGRASVPPANVGPPRSVVADPAASMFPPFGPVASTSPSTGGRSPGDELAIAQVVTAPSVAVKVHEDAGDGASREGTLHPRTSGSIRELARRLAQDSNGNFVGVNYPPDDKWSVPLFSSAAEADAWYDHLTDTPDMFKYVAYFDKTSPAWPNPVNEIFGSGRALNVSERPIHQPADPAHDLDPQPSFDPPISASPTPPIRIPARQATPGRQAIQARSSSSGYSTIAAIGAVAVLGVLTVFAGRRRRRV